MWQCSCGASHPDEQKFCTKCGQAKPAPAPVAAPAPAKPDPEKQAKKKKAAKTALIATICTLVAAGLLVLAIYVVIPMLKYNNAVKLMGDGKYSEAITAFKDLDGYKDSKKKIKECNQLLEEQEEEAIDDAVADVALGYF